MPEEQKVALLAQFYDYAVSNGADESDAATISFLSEGCQIEEDTTERLARSAIKLAQTGGPILERHRTWIMIGEGYSNLPKNQQTEATRPYRHYVEVYRRSLECARARTRRSRIEILPARAPLLIGYQSSAYDSPDRPSAPHTPSPSSCPNPMPVQHARSAQQSGGQRPNPPEPLTGAPACWPSAAASLHAAAHHMPVTSQAISTRSSPASGAGPGNALQLNGLKGEVERAREQWMHQPTITIGQVCSPRSTVPGR